MSPVGLISLESFSADGLFSDEDLSLANSLERKGSGDFTIGCEVEITTSSYQDIKPSSTFHPEQLEALLGKYGFHYGRDELYEVISPPFSHPRSLALAHTCLARLGVIPQETNGSTPMHVSIGAPEVKEVYNDHKKLFDIITILRLTEQLGTTSPGRLLSGVEAWNIDNFFQPNQTWATRGVAGVSSEVPPNPAFTKWVGKNYRLEFRTPNFQSLSSQQTAIDSIYYLTRAYLSPRTTIGDIANSTLDFGFEYFNDLGVKQLPEVLTYSRITNVDDLYEAWNSLGKTGFMSYMRPYANHLCKTKGSSELSTRVQESVRNIQEELMMVA